MTERNPIGISLSVIALLVALGATGACRLKDDDDAIGSDGASGRDAGGGQAGSSSQSGRDAGPDAARRDASSAGGADEDGGDELDGGAERCPEAAPGDADSDRDGELDACDPDDDGDGFLDADDPLPRDATVPGNFSTPEAILDDPRVRAALEAAEAAGFSLGKATQRTPPDISGYWLIPDASGKFVATGDGADVGRSRIGTETRREVNAELVSRVVSVSFSGSTRTSYSLADGNLVRGQDGAFTEYARYKLVCNESRSNFAMFGIGMLSGSVEQATGDLIDVRLLSVTVATSGELTSACKTRFSGDSDQVGGWSLAAIPRVQKRSVDQLERLCVDGDRAYAPTETWTSATGAACRCGTDYMKTCE